MSEGTENTAAQQIGEVLASFEPGTQPADAPASPDAPAVPDAPTAPDAPAAPDEPDPVAALNAKVLELEQKLAAKEAAPAPEEPAFEAWADQDFVPEGFDIDTLDRAGLNKLLNAAAGVAYKNAQEGAVKRVLTTVPSMVRNSVVTHSKIQKALNEFYDANKELAPHSKQVGFIAEQLLAADPALGNDVEGLFKKAGEEARKRLGIEPGQKPGSRGGLTVVQGQGGTPAQSLEGVAGEIDAMEKALK